MGIRTTDVSVRSVTSLDSSVTLDGFIETASKMVDLVEAAGETDTKRLELIERWLTAHLVTVTINIQAVKEKIEDSEVWYATTSGQDLDASPYGRQAKALDSTYTLEDQYGTMAKLLWVGDNDPDGPDPS